MASDQLVPAIWRGPFDGELADGRTVRNGDTVMVTKRELESAHFEEVPKAKVEKAVERLEKLEADS